MIILVPEFGFSAGSETVLLRVLPRWVGAGHAVVLAAPMYRLKHYLRRGLDPRVRRVELGWPDTGWRRWMRRMVHRLSSHVLFTAGLKDQVRREGVTHVFVPWVVDQPAVNFNRPTGIMVMDRAWRHYPEGWFGKTSAALDARLAAWLRTADVVFPVSEATAAEVAAVFPEHVAKQVTVPHGAKWRGGLRGERSGEPYFLTPASLTPNKDHLTLLRAAVALWQQSTDFRLIWTGRGTEAVTSERQVQSAETRLLQACYRENSQLIAGRLEARGFVADEELDRLYARARRIVLPSTYEGFGLPVLEAFERGARVICTTIPPFEEQVRRHGMGKRATRVPAGDEVALAAALRAACAEDAAEDTAEDTAELKQAVEAWTWDDAAREYVRTLEALR